MTKNNALPKRKPNRLQGYDYSSNGVYFVTICTQNKECVLSRIVGDGVLDVPKIELSKYGKAVDEQIALMNSMLDNVIVEKYVIMPNHIHLLIRIENISENGTSRAPSPTNSVIAIFVSTLKRFTNKNAGEKIWQRSYYDHIVRNENEYLKIWEYINSNAQKWQNDKYYTGD